MMTIALRLTFAALLAVTTAPAMATDVTPAPGETLLEIQAEGHANVMPDAAFLNVRVVSTGRTAREATDANAQTMNAVIAAVRSTGVDPRYIRTQQINVDPRFARADPSDYQGQAQITGYVARNSVAVTVIRLAKASDVIAAFGAGANSVSGPNLGNEDPTMGVAAARKNALVQARAQANTYAAGLGMKVSRLLRVSERGSTFRPVNYVVVTGTRASLAIAGGGMRRTVTVWIDYAMTRQ